MDDCKETVSSRHNRANAYLNSQRLWKQGYDFHRFNPDGVTTLRGGSRHGIYSQSKSYFQLKLDDKVKISFLKCVIGHTKHISGKTLRPGAVRQHRLSFIIVYLFVYFCGLCFLWHFCLIGSFLIDFY